MTATPPVDDDPRHPNEVPDDGLTHVLSEEQLYRDDLVARLEAVEEEVRILREHLGGEGTEA